MLSTAVPSSIHNGQICERSDREAQAVKNFSTFSRVMFIVALLCFPTVGSAGTINFETRPNGTTPTDNEELTASYVDASTVISFGFDTDGDLAIDVNARFEKRGNDAIFAYLTDTDEDADKTGTGQGGEWTLRRPKTPEPNPVYISEGDAFLVKYSGTLVSSASGEMWDIDSGEQYLIEAYDVANVSLGSVLSFIGPNGSGIGGCCGGPTDGLPFTFSFNNLSAPIATIKITEVLVGGTGAGFTFDNFSTTSTPEPSSIALLMGGMLLLGWRLRKA